MYNDAEKAGRIQELDFDVRMFCEDLKKRNRGRLPKPKGGRPTAEHRRLLIAVHVEEEIEARGRKWGSVEEALKEVAKRDGAAERYVRNIYNDREPEWRRAVAVELAWRKHEANKG
jgi:hypothetical protein